MNKTIVITPIKNDATFTAKLIAPTLSGNTFTTLHENRWIFRVTFKKNISVSKWKLKKVFLPSQGCSLANWAITSRSHDNFTNVGAQGYSDYQFSFSNHKNFDRAIMQRRNFLNWVNTVAIQDKTSYTSYPFVTGFMNVGSQKMEIDSDLVGWLGDTNELTNQQPRTTTQRTKPVDATLGPYYLEDTVAEWPIMLPNVYFFHCNWGQTGSDDQVQINGNQTQNNIIPLMFKKQDSDLQPACLEFKPMNKDWIIHTNLKKTDYLEFYFSTQDMISNGFIDPLRHIGNFEGFFAPTTLLVSIQYQE